MHTSWLYMIYLNLNLVNKYLIRSIQILNQILEMNCILAFLRFIFKLYIIVLVIVHLCFFFTSKTAHYLTFQNFSKIKLKIKKFLY
jgi:hypothetical protein